MKLFPLVLFIFISFFISCRNPTQTYQSHDIAISLGSDASLPELGMLILRDDEGMTVASIKATKGDLILSSELDGSYELEFFSDSDGDGVLGSDEEISLVSFGTINTNTYNGEIISCGIVHYQGQVTFHVDWPSTARRYILSENLYLGTERIVPVEDDGRFSFYDKRMEDGQTYKLSSFRDDDESGSYNWKSDPYTMLLLENGGYSDESIRVEQIRISGTVNVGEFSAAGLYPLDGSTTAPVLSIEDQSYWSTSYQYLPSDGIFKIYSAVDHTLDIHLNHTLETPSEMVKSVDESLAYPVRLSGVQYYSSDSVIYGDTGGSIDIHKLTVKVQDNSTDYAGKPLFIRMGQSPISYRLYNGISPASGSSGNVSYIVPFRDFDRTTASDGISHDATLSEKTTGYGSFVQFQVFIDTNRDGVLNPAEPSSQRFYYGDTNSDQSPTWDSDWDELNSDSNILSGFTLQEQLNIN